ncbi:MAG: RNA-binding protein [Rubellimicrobium sp.]|nr:RNA-binding protein [Rubellimicrobium sp.]
MVIRACGQILAFVLALAGAAAVAQQPPERPQARPEALADSQGRDTGAAALANLASEATRGPTPVIPPEPQMPDARALAPPDEPTTGPETNLPLPRFVSLKSGDANVRRGPSLSHRIDWVFTRAGMPLMITAEYGNWRRVVDREGLGGWVHYALLSGARTVIVDKDMEPLYVRPATDAPVNAVLEAGVIARIDRCDPDWCRISSGGYRGWAPKGALWGVGADEVLD